MQQVLLLIAALALQTSPAYSVRGIVVDAAGLPIESAEVSVDGGSTLTRSDGSFSLAVSQPEAFLRVRVAGFDEYASRVQATRPLRIILHPASLAAAVTVTAGRSQKRLADTATATSVFPSAVLLTSAGLTMDDVLRAVPGFSLFRRSSSRVANPTTQGAGLRGLAASGASRALVMADGIPVNDPFGGWVYWNRVPQAAVDRLEVVRGGSGTDLYGHESLAGTVQVTTVRPSRTVARVALEGGQHGSARVSAYGGGTNRGGWQAFGSAERFVFDGFPIVAAAERGPVDVPAGTRHTSALAAVGREGAGRSLDVRASWLGEERENGTPLQWNDTRLWSTAARLTGSHERGGWLFSAYGGGTRYRQTFSAVNATRTVETLTATQHVRANHQGASVQWSGTAAGHAFLAGGDFRRVEGESLDVQRGGTQNDGAAYGRLTLSMTERVTVNAGIRVGVWNGSDAYVMPRVSVAWSPVSDVSVSASWSAPGRTPTLNELHRDFRVGGTITLANVRLTPERASAFEAGVLVRARAASARLTTFWTEVDDAITNVTLSSGTPIIRQRQNAGVVRARGVEIEGDWRAAQWAGLTASGAWLDSRFTSSGEPGLTGLRVPQVPRWQAAASLRLTPGRLVSTFDWRALGAQFDDDRNQFVLRRAFVTDAYVGISVRKAQPFVAIENAFDVEVDVGRTPVRTVGTPRSVRAGLRIFF